VTKSAELAVIEADWAAPPSIQALTTTRTGGSSKAPFDTLNIGDHVDDDPRDVARNRKYVKKELKLPSKPIWLNQVHGARVAEVAKDTSGTIPTADAAVTRDRGCVLAVMTADCLPVILCSPEHSVVAAVHGGWRSLAADILQNTVTAMDCPPSSIHAWLGPAIGPDKFAVGDDVFNAFVAKDWQMADCFKTTDQQKFMADLYAIARRSLSTLGVEYISGGSHCTYTESDTFYSYRREAKTGRMVTLTWMES